MAADAADSDSESNSHELAGIGAEGRKESTGKAHDGKGRIPDASVDPLVRRNMES